MVDRLDCGGAREQLSACADGEAERTATLELHLAGCAECRDFAVSCAALAGAFTPLRDELPPADLESRLIARATPRPLLRLARGGVVARVAAGVMGMAAIGAAALVTERLASESRGAHASTRYVVLSGWLEPLAGRALHPGDEELRGWLETAAIQLGEERR